MYIHNKLLENINPILLVKNAEELLNNGYVILHDIHIHNDCEDYASINEVYIDKNDKFVSKISVSGGKNECVFNDYIEIFDSAYEALNYGMSFIEE